jgi:hypothetical protein
MADSFENTANTDRYNKNFNFLKQHHNENFTLLPDSSFGESTSMQLGTFGIDGKTYILPTFSKKIYNETGKVESNIDNPVDMFIEQIRNGTIQGYNSIEQADMAMRDLRNEIIKN